MSDDRVLTEQIAADFARSDTGMRPEERFGLLIDLISDQFGPTVAERGA